MKIYAYDLEVYRNFFSAIFINIHDENDNHEFCLYKNRDDIDDLIKFLQQSNLRLVGYNSNGYDNLIIKAIMNRTKQVTNIKLFNLSSEIIHKKPKDYGKYVKQLRYDPTPFESVDLMELVSINTARPSLKHCGIHLKSELIQDLPLNPVNNIKLSDIDLLLKYNWNDVKITRDLYLKLLPDIELRENLGKQYDVDLLSASDSKIAKIVLDSAYGIPENKATNRKVLKVKDLLPSKLEFDTHEMKEFLNNLKGKNIHVNNKT